MSDPTPGTVPPDIGAWGPTSRHLEKLQAFADAGYSQVALVQVGPDQEQFCEWFISTLKPAAAGLVAG